MLREFVTRDFRALGTLKRARKEQREIVKLAAECKRDIGGVRQLRLALAA